MERHEIINFLSTPHSKTYLEIGVDWGTTFNQITIAERTGVDPCFKVPQAEINGHTAALPSDAFFAENNQAFDCIFIDGLHTYAQSKRDFVNGWSVLNAGGIIIIDDCYPADAIAAMSDVDQSLKMRRDRGEPENMTWMGDVYKTVIWINDCTDYAYAYVKESPGIVVVWQDKQPNRRKFMPSEADIDNCDFESFKTLRFPVKSLKQIASKIRLKTKLLERLFVRS
jgi:hypothetical protein